MTNDHVLKPIADKAEVSVDFPDKVYFGEFGHASRFEAHCDPDSMVVKLRRDGGEKREVILHLHHMMFAGILDDLAVSVAREKKIDQAHAGVIAEAATKLAAALAKIRT